MTDANSSLFLLPITEARWKWMLRKKHLGTFFRKEFHAWRAMKARCCKASHPSYPSYGAKGVTVCNSWTRSFRKFMADMGPAPAKEYSLDRIDPFGNYEPGNCRWATPEEQYRNTRRAKLIESGAIQPKPKKCVRRRIAKKKPTKKRGTFPPYPVRPHSSKQARIVVRGVTIYLGAWGSEQSRQRYEALKQAHPAPKG